MQEFTPLYVKGGGGGKEDTKKTYKQANKNYKPKFIFWPHRVYHDVNGNIDCVRPSIKQKQGKISKKGFQCVFFLYFL